MLLLGPAERLLGLTAIGDVAHGDDAQVSILKRHESASCLHRQGDRVLGLIVVTFEDGRADPAPAVHQREHASGIPSALAAAMGLSLFGTDLRKRHVHAGTRISSWLSASIRVGGGSGKPSCVQTPRAAGRGARYGPALVAGLGEDVGGAPALRLLGRSTGGVPRGAPEARS